MAESLNLANIGSELQDIATDNKDHFFDGVYGVGETDADTANSIPSMAEYAAELDTPNEVVLTNVYAAGAWQPGGKKTASGKVFNPTADAVALTPRVAKVEHVAMTFLFEQAVLVLLKKSYLSGVRANSINADEIPFGQYLLNNLMMKAKEELRLAYFQAIHNAEGTAYTALFDGYRKQILDAIVSGDIPAGNVIDTAVISATTGVAVMEDIVDGIPTKYLNSLVCLCSRQAKRFYEKDYRTRYGTLPYNNGMTKSFIDGSGIEFMVEPGLDGFDRPLFVPRNNFVRLYDSSDNANLTIDYDARERDIAVVVDGQAGCGFANGEHIWTNDNV